MQNVWGIRISTGIVVFPGVLLAVFYGIYLVTLTGMFEIGGYAIGRDFVNIWTGGRHVLDGGDAAELFDFFRYHHIQEAYFRPDYLFHNWSYPPHLLLFAPLVGVFPYPLAFAVWVTATSAAFAAAICAGQPDALRKAGFVLLAPAVAVNIFFGQNGLLTAALAIGAVRLLGPRPVLAGVLLGLLTIKPQLGVLFPLFLIITRQWRAFASASLTTIALVLASLAVFGTEPWVQFLTVTLKFQSTILTGGEGLFSFMFTGTYAWAGLVGLPPAVASAIHGGLALAAGGIALAAAVSPDRDLTTKGMIVLIATPLMSPYMMNYDLAMVVAPLLYFTAIRPDRGDRVRPLVLLLWMLPLVPLMKIWLPLPYTQILLMWLLVEAVRTTAPAVGRASRQAALGA